MTLSRETSSAAEGQRHLRPIPLRRVSSEGSDRDELVAAEALAVREETGTPTSSDDAELEHLVGGAGNEGVGREGGRTTMDDYEADGEEGADGIDEPLLERRNLIVERLRNEMGQDLKQGDVYQRKSKIVNRAIQDIGLGKYQWQLFVLCGFGWFADNLWMQGLALTLPSLSTEFGVSETHVRFTTMITYFGLSFGSVLWGLLSDSLGRRIAFNATLFIAGLFGTLVAFGPTWPITAILFAGMGFGVGGNLPVDGALFLEFLPQSEGRLLTLLSVWWPFGQLFSSVVAWLLIPPYSCPADQKSCSLSPDSTDCCSSSANRGWRYFIGTLGVFTLVMFACRFFLFHLYESPKFLLSRGRQEEAVTVVKQIAHYNGTKTWLDVKLLDQLVEEDDIDEETGGLNVAAIGKKQLGQFKWGKVKQLFRPRKLAVTTVLLWIIWATVGMAYPLFNAFLPQYLEHSGNRQEPTPVSHVYRNYFITSIAGVPGSFLATYTVDIPYLGRKGTMALSTLVTGISLFLFVYSSAESAQTFASALQSLFSNVMYGVIYAYTPEVFPAPVRGTGSGIASLLNRIAGLMAPIIAAEAGSLNSSAPIVAAGLLYFVAFLAMVGLPIETRGVESL